jgi:hypothetical protein
MKSKGLGDTIKKITHFFGIEQCEPCKERQKVLNRIFPYKNKTITMTQEQIDIIEHYIKEPTSKIGCQVLNDLRYNIDGVKSGSCFCYGYQMDDFMNEFKNWYIDVKKNESK